MKGEVIEVGIESVLDYESAADVLDTVAQHREVGVYTIVEDISK
jgi:predicted DNA-binding protein